MKKLYKAMAGAGVFALSLGLVAGLAGNVAAIAAEPAETDIGSVKPIVSLDFEDLTVGETFTEAHSILNATNNLVWDLSYTLGQVVNEEAFGGSKAYRFTASSTGTSNLGGVHLPGSVLGVSYDLSMKMTFENADFIYVQYVSDGGHSIEGWGSANVYPDNKVLIQGGSKNISNIRYIPETHEFRMTFTANHSNEDNGPGFIRFSVEGAKEGTTLTVDDILVQETPAVINYDFENKDTGKYEEAESHIYVKESDHFTAENIAYGEAGNHALKLSNSDVNREWIDEFYINRLGLLCPEANYRISFDFDLQNIAKFYLCWKGQYGEMTNDTDIIGIAIIAGTEGVNKYSYAEPENVRQDLLARITNLKCEYEGEGAKKGKLSFEFVQLGNHQEPKFVAQSASVGTEAAIILDNLKIERVNHTITAKSESGHGKIEAETFNPYKGNDLTVSVVPEEGYQLKSFKVDGEDAQLTDGKYKFENVEADHAITAEFEKKPITISVTKEHATVTTDKDINSYKYGDTVTLTVTAEEGYRILTVRVNGDTVTLTDGQYVIAEAKGDITVAVIAAAIPTYTMTYTVTPNGGGTVTVDAASVQEGGTATYTVTPAEGYRVKSVKYNNKAVELTGGKYVAENVEKNGKLEVEFEKIPTDPVDPGTTEPEPSDPGTTDPEPEKKGGCGGVIGTGAAILSALTVAGVSAVLFVRKKH